MTPGTELLTIREAAQRLGLAVATLNKWRSTRRYKLQFIKVGGRVRYTTRAVEEFLTSRTVTPGQPPKRGRSAR